MTLQVYTTRLRRDHPDPDLLDITVGTAARHVTGWGNLPADPRDRQRLLDERAVLVRLGLGVAVQLERRSLTLAQIQRYALDEHRPGPAQPRPSLGAPWAPSWPLLNAAKAAMGSADQLGQAALTLPASEDRSAMLAEAERLTTEAWTAYRDGWADGDRVEVGFLEEMRESWRVYRPAWGWLLARDRVALGCFCGRPAWWPEGQAWACCHRFATADLLVKCGARYLGELPEPEPAQQGLPGMT